MICGRLDRGGGCFAVAIYLARGTAVTASVPSDVAPVAAAASVLSKGILTASAARGPDIALGLPGFRETV